MELEQPTALLLGWDKFPDAKESVMKYCNSVVIGDIDAYLNYHMGDDVVRHLTFCDFFGSSNGKTPYLHTFVYHHMCASNMRLLIA
jgi:hypothetical protein